MTRLRARPLLALLAIALLLTIPALAVAKQPAGIGSTAPARVFLPNPVATLQNESLTDQKDADYAALQPAYRRVTLTDLDGSGRLVGGGRRRERDRRARLRAGRHVRLQPPRRPLRAGDGLLLGHRGAEVHPVARLRLDATRHQQGAQAVRINQLGVDNSFATDHPKDEMRFGKGGVDDAEDAEVILHEYGHQIQTSASPPRSSTAASRARSARASATTGP